MEAFLSSGIISAPSWTTVCDENGGRKRIRKVRQIQLFFLSHLFLVLSLVHEGQLEKVPLAHVI